MSKPDYDNPDVEEHWCEEQQTVVEEYLRSQKVQHRRIGDWPAWHIAPYVSIWAIESCVQPERIGWWVICGDLPTDYISASDLSPPQHPRKAIRGIAQRWLKIVESWSKGQDYDGIQVSESYSNEALAPLLQSRSELLIEWADNDTLWEEE
jgi:Domain of unknown function (DUF4826)